MEENTPKIPFKKIFWPSFVAVLSASILGMILFVMVIGAIIGGIFGSLDDNPVEIKEKTILHLQLDGPIKEKSKVSLEPSSLTVNTSLGLPDILYALDKASQDDRIKGVYIDIGDIECGISTARSIRKAIEQFKIKSNKKVYTLYAGERISQIEYYIGSCGDKIYAFPTTNFMLTGLGTEYTFFKNLLDKVGVEVEVIRGENNDFKSAVEPFFLSKLSDSARYQSTVLLNNMWSVISQDICKSRKIEIKDWNAWLNRLTITNASSALNHRLVDGLAYQDEMMALWKKEISLLDSEDLYFVSFEAYARNAMLEDQLLAQEGSATAIAVVVAEGEITTEGQELSSKKLCRELREVREDNRFDVVVLRINSPGGSALASEEIWREVWLTQQKKKVVVSMGDVAASGGYYIATPAEIIFCDPTTITGSIGVFGMIPYAGKLLNNTFGITFDTVQTNHHSVLSFTHKLSKEELSVVQQEVNTIYKQFLKRVAEGRKMSSYQANLFARGRVWSGNDALRIKLVDRMGDLTDAINYAKSISKSINGSVVYFPKVEEDFSDKLLRKLLGSENSELNPRKDKELTKYVLEQFNSLKNIESKMGIQMRMPYDLFIRF
jgi:protease-4